MHFSSTGTQALQKLNFQQVQQLHAQVSQLTSLTTGCMASVSRLSQASTALTAAQLASLEDKFDQRQAQILKSPYLFNLSSILAPWLFGSKSLVTTTTTLLWQSLRLAFSGSLAFSGILADDILKTGSISTLMSSDHPHSIRASASNQMQLVRLHRLLGNQDPSQ